jgi:hypothetical protein
MTDTVSPSPIIKCFLRGFKDFLPDDQKSRLATHEDAIAATTSDADDARARHCAVWAIKAADDKNASHPRWKEIRELHEIWKDVWFGVEFSLGGVAGKVPSKTSVGDDIHTEWAESASHVVRKLAEEDGWEHSQWESLLTELIDAKDL